MGVNSILDLLSLSPNLPVLVCDETGCIQGGNCAASAVVRQEIAQLKGRNLLGLFSSQTLHGASSFSSFAELAQHGIPMQFDEPLAGSVIVRVREVGVAASLFVVSMEQASSETPSQADLRLNTQELERQVKALRQLTEYAATMSSQNRSEESWASLLKLVTQVVYAADTRKQLERLCEREKLRYQDAIQHAKLVIWELDPKTNCFTFVSESCEALSGYAPDEWYEPEFWEKHLHSDDRDVSVDFCKNATEQKVDHRFEYRMVTKDGGIIWLDDIVQVVLGDGDVVGLRGTLIDITERKSLELQLLQAQKMEAIGNLTSGIAHDFNNLLTVIVSSSELLQLQSPKMLEEDARDLVHAIQDAADRACQLTDQLLLFSRSSVPQRQSVDINAAITESHQFLSRVLGDGKQFSVKLEPSLPHVRIDPTHLQQVLLNLVVNARDAMPDGGLLTVHTKGAKHSFSQTSSPVRTLGTGNFAVLSVSDTGVGIPADLKSRIFDPFFTTKPVGSGTGLGLSVVYGIVHEAGGFIEVDSDVGGGTEFRVYFPIIASEIRSSDAELVDLPSGQKTILVVEDDPSVMRVTVKTLQQAGYHVISIPDPVEAQRFVSSSSHRIDLMVTDVSMPTMSGPDLAQAIQDSAESLPFPVLFISGNDQHFLETKHGISADAPNFLQKPFRISTLIMKAQQLLSNPVS